MVLHYNIKVTGKVQGVWYRKSTLEKALDLGIKGIVKNMADGSVYIEAEGNPDQLEDLIIWCKKGPEFAVVQDVSFKEAPLQFFTKFEILS